jgi:hypothetical protein
MGFRYGKEKLFFEETIFHLVASIYDWYHRSNLLLKPMNADLYTVLLLLGCVGLFLAIVVGRLQFSQEDDVQKEVVDRIEAAKSLLADYQTQSDVAEKLGANLARNDFLPMISRMHPAHEDGELTPGRLFRRALAIYEAIEHVDDPENADRTYQRTVEEFGLGGPSELQRADLKTMLRLARISIHARAQGENIESYKKQVAALIQNGDLILSEGGQLRMREVLTLLQTQDMQALTEEYRDFIPVIEELLLSDPVSAKRST